jgi:uroporphyrinogen decarboxylase
VNTRAVVAYLDEQIRAGVDAVMLFDTWGGLLTTGRVSRVLARFDAIRADSVAPCARRAGPFRDRVHQRRRPVARFARRLRRAVHRARLDRRSRRARRRVGAQVALQGNLDPLALWPTRGGRRAATAVVRAAGTAPGHIFNWATASFRPLRRRTSPC